MHEVVSPDTCIMYLIHKHQAYLSKRGPRFRNSYSSRVSRERDNSCPTSSIRFYGKFSNQFIFHVSFHDFDAPIPLCKSFRGKRNFFSRSLPSSSTDFDILISPFIYSKFCRNLPHLAWYWRQIFSNNYIPRNILATWIQNRITHPFFESLLHSFSIFPKI